MEAFSVGITGNTKVMTTLGWITVKQLYELNINFISGYNHLVLKQSKMEPVRGIIREKKNPPISKAEYPLYIYRIDLECGRILNTTQDQKFYTKQDKKVMTIKALKDIKVGDSLFVNTCFGLFGNVYLREAYKMGQEDAVCFKEPNLERMMKGTYYTVAYYLAGLFSSTETIKSDNTNILRDIQLLISSFDIAVKIKDNSITVNKLFKFRNRIDDAIQQKEMDIQISTNAKSSQITSMKRIKVDDVYYLTSNSIGGIILNGINVI